MGEPARVVAWLEEHQASLVGRVVEAAGLRLVGAGSPGRGRAGAAAAALGVGALDDLRAALAEADCDLVLLASPGEFGASSADLAPLVAARSRGVRIASLEPIPATAIELAGGGWTGGNPRPIDAVRFCPLARSSRSFRDAAEVLQMFGPVRTLAVETCCTPAEGSLGARLFAAMELVHWLMGEPETIDAAFAGPAQGPGVHALPGETLRDLHGDLTANLRYADGRAACVLASDQSGRWSRTATLLGPNGRLRVFEDGFEWVSRAGEKVDQARRTKKRGSEPTPHAVEAIAESLSRLIDPSAGDDAPLDHESLLCMSQAALLSARTANGESPATIRRMVSVQ
ncbi:MAG: hypothetical protein DYG93_01730 [Leptolyngbya sp. PLA2]|nr:hypothetical protein [Leptolyngbya sp. PL-A2]MCQ3941063.1 hypothetical protein [cyanobacterium CYA1]MCZ7633073.1 hypothetical protein [Phycisphaerales bacterium]MDL1905656.1 hypothetical protein [Synechococcales cyanobacterium CNB]GIK18867.1 MAG: hypothetical protein BroJett004_10310 [Planctomycetota bacterium]